MGLEAGTYISDLVATNPVHATDSVGEGDDHLRLIKSCLLNSLPGITGAMTLTHTQLNNAAIKDEANTFTATQTVDAALHCYGGNPFRIYDSDESAWITFQHDGTDLNVTGNATTDINLTSITAINAGTVDADFDALTATSYGGITEANLVDKTASETISGATWDFQAITAVSFGGIASANLVDKSASETISGTWTYSGTLTANAVTVNTAAVTENGSGHLEVDGDVLMKHNSTSYASGEVFFNTSAPTTEGANGDVWFQYTA